MTELKVHKGIMTAKLRCGGLLKCHRDDSTGFLRGVRVSWLADGSFYSAGVETDIDIVEIVSKPPARTLKDVIDAGELVDGMLFKHTYPDGCFIQVMVSKTDNKSVGVLSDKTSVLGAYDLRLFRDDSAASYVLVEETEHDMACLDCSRPLLWQQR